MNHIQEITDLRNARVHISGVMLMGIINKLVTRTKTAYLGEISGYYAELSGEHSRYTDAGIRAQLNRLKHLGYVKVLREGTFCRYDLTQKGHHAMQGFDL